MRGYVDGEEWLEKRAAGGRNLRRRKMKMEMEKREIMISMKW